MVKINVFSALEVTKLSTEVCRNSAQSVKSQAIFIMSQPLNNIVTNKS